MRIGSAFVLTLHVEAPSGQVRDTRQLRLASIEEAPVAAPRLVDALWSGTALTKTRQVSNLVGQETRKYDKVHGEFLYGAGVLGLYAAGSDTGVQPGLDLQTGYESERFGVGADLRFGLGSDGHEGQTADYFALGVGGRYFLSSGNVGPFVGGGVTWSNLEVYDGEWSDEAAFQGDGSGIGLYGEVGLQLLRLHASRLTFDLRFETPLYLLEQDTYAYSGSVDANGEPVVSSQPGKKFVVPVMVGLSYTL